jgi:hypothetical protein
VSEIKGYTINAGSRVERVDSVESENAEVQSGKKKGNGRRCEVVVVRRKKRV